MYFQSLSLENFRNLAQLSLPLDPGVNLIWGENGAGKTAILEGLYLLMRGRSFRTPSFQDCLQQGKAELLLRAVLTDDSGPRYRMGLRRTKAGERQLRLNGENCTRQSEVAGLVSLLLIDPTVSELVFGSPGLRRQFLDWGLFHVEHAYLDALKQYQRILRQRNAGLRAARERRTNLASLNTWTDYLVPAAERVEQYRSDYLLRLRPLFQETLTQLSPTLSLEIQWWPGWHSQSDLRKTLGENLDKEVKYGLTRIGPHRADLILIADGKPAASTLSRGQGKLVAIALLLAQARLLREMRNTRSVFLLDDVIAELDRHHADTLFGLLKDLASQILVTTTRPETVPGAGLGIWKMFHVEQGDWVTQQAEPNQ